MPCYDPHPYDENIEDPRIKQLEDKVNKLEAILCGILNSWVYDTESLFEIEAVIKHDLCYDSEKSGVDSSYVAKWYMSHRDKDLERKKLEDEKAKKFLENVDPEMLEAIKRIIT